MKDPNDTRDIGPRAGSPLWIHMTAVTGAGVVVLAWAVSRLGLAGLNHLAHNPRFWVIAVLVVVGEVRPIVTPGKPGPDAPVVSLAFSFAALLSSGDLHYLSRRREAQGAASHRVQRGPVHAEPGRRRAGPDVGRAAPGAQPALAAERCRAAGRGAGRDRLFRRQLPAGRHRDSAALARAVLPYAPGQPALPGLRQLRAAVRRAAGGRDREPLAAAPRAVPAAADRDLRQRRDLHAARAPGAP